MIDHGTYSVFFFALETPSLHLREKIKIKIIKSKRNRTSAIRRKCTVHFGNGWISYFRDFFWTRDTWTALSMTLHQHIRRCAVSRQLSSEGCVARWWAATERVFWSDSPFAKRDTSRPRCEDDAVQLLDLSWQRISSVHAQNRMVESKCAINVP